MYSLIGVIYLKNKNHFVLTFLNPIFSKKFINIFHLMSLLN